MKSNVKSLTSNHRRLGYYFAKIVVNAESLVKMFDKDGTDDKNGSKLCSLFFVHLTGGILMRQSNENNSMFTKKEVKILLYQKVKEATLRARSNNPGAVFYIPIEDFMEFVTFHLIAFIKMRNPITSEQMSMNQYLQQDKAYSESYKKVAITDEEEYIP